MPTIQQLVRKGREQLTFKSKSPALAADLNRPWSADNVTGIDHTEANADQPVAILVARSAAQSPLSGQLVIHTGAAEARVCLHTD